MGVLFRVVVTFSIIATFSIIFFSSFFTEPRYFTLPSFSDKQITGTGTIETGTGSVIYKNTYDTFHKVYSDSQEYNSSFTQTGKVLDIGETGKILTSFRDIGSHYQISGPGYKISQEGVGEVFIDTLSSPGKVFVMPINTSVKVSLVSSDGTEKYTDIFLTPHMYLEFQPVRGRFLKNADSIRVETVYRLGYFGGRIGDLEGDNVLKKYSGGTNIFLTSVIEDINKHDIVSQQYLRDFTQKEVGRIPGYDAIQRYLHLFVNQEKQKVFYKNMILENTLLLLHEDDYDDSKIQTIKKDLETLREIDKDSHDEVFDLIRYIQYTVFSSYREDDIIAQIYLGSLGSDQTMSSKYFQLYGYVLFSSYNAQEKFSSDVFIKHLDSFSSTVESLNSDSRNFILRYQYFSYFLEKQIHFLLDSVGAEEFPFVNYILQNYTETSALGYNAGPTEKVTALYVYNELLKKLDTFIRNEGFLPERSQDSVLVLHPDNNIPSREVKILKEQVEILYAIYSRNKGLLNKNDLRDQSIMEEMEETQVRMNEYFEALENYERYESKYNTVKQSLSDIDTFGFREDIIIDLNEAQEYFSQFVGFPLSGVDVTVVDENYYEVKNAYIAGKNFSFDLRPFEEYKMENIVIGEENLDFVYKLGRIEEVWDERYKTAGNDTKHLYDFSRFFLITFFTQDDPNIEIYSIEDTRLNEDKTEVIFKRDTLLGEKGEFSSVKNVLTVEYDDIRLERNSQGYDIFLTDTEGAFNLEINQNGNKTQIEMDAEYILTQDDHYFTDVKIKVLQNIVSEVKAYEFDGQQISFVGKVYIGEYASIVKDFLENTPYYFNVYSSIKSRFGDINISMQYALRNNKLSFKFDSDGKNYTILVNQDLVDVIYRGTEKLTDEAIPVQDVSAYLE